MSTDAPDDFGARLRQAREASGRTLRDLAETTKLGVRTLEALERNQPDRLPPAIFRRSVVRAYAREVGLDPEQTLKEFLARHPDDLPPPGLTTGPLADLPPRGAPWSRLVLLGAIAALLLGLGVSCWVTGRTAGARVTHGGHVSVASHRDLQRG